MAGTCQRFFVRLQYSSVFCSAGSSMSRRVHTPLSICIAAEMILLSLVRGDRIPSADDGVVGRLDAIHIAVKQDTKTLLLLIHDRVCPGTIPFPFLFRKHVHLRSSFFPMPLGLIEPRSGVCHLMCCVVLNLVRVFENENSKTRGRLLGLAEFGNGIYGSF